MYKKNTVVITGLGVISPVGLNADALFRSLSIATSGIRRCDADPLSKPFPAGLIPESFTERFTKLELPYLDRCQQMAILAARQAITDAGFDNFAEYGQRAGLYYGSVKGGVATEQAWYQQLLVEGKQAARPFTAMAIMQNAGASQISIRHQIQGPVMTHGSACSSSGAAIGEAFRAIRDGYLDVAVVGGAEAPLTSSGFGAFDGIRALAMADPTDISRSCKPFSSDRTGLVMGEGAAFIVLESAQHAKQRGAACFAALSGYGISSDAYHIGTPNADGQTAALRAALADAGLQPSDIDYFNAHGTATRGGDEVEANAICAVFGARSVPVSSTKSIHGHLLGATSALELVITILAMTESFLPATAHLDAIDPKCALNHVANTPLFNRQIEHAMSFSCGFGGTNVALAISKHREMPARRHSVSV
ncbi:beta-ketoacyl-[acyl-carrier-protein] synthase family protein [Undibacterium arcticum]|uniref:Nodulation protein E n=1 Tax=Undibacterium arcticum TaxID=1762892 RepID=A0ABV7F3S5_9BURK